jgi:putative oxidoreductase
MSVGRLLLRTAIGGFFVGHGTQKLFGWFGGYGLEPTSQMFGQLGLRPAKAHAVAAGLGEAGGGVGLVLGAYTPLSSSVIVATMLTAIRTVHAKNGPWATNQGWEYNGVLIAAALALAETGPGSPSIDAARGREASGARPALLALALGVAGAVGAKLISDAFPEPAAEAESAGPPPEPAVPADPEPAATDPSAGDASAPPA